jgi:predicted dehydrogenase
MVAGAEIRRNLLNKVSSKWKFEGYTDYEKMLKKEDLDIVCILTGPRFTREITEKVAEYGVNILVEKPMALSMEDANAMIEVCEKNSVKLCYGESFRFFPTCKKAKDMIDDGRLGELSLLLETFIGGNGPEQFQPYHIYPIGAPGSGGRGLTDHGIHLVNIFRWFTGSDVKWVFGRGIRAGQPPDTEFLTMGFNSGAIGQLIYNESAFSSYMPYEGLFSWGSYNAQGESKWDRQPGNFSVHGSNGALRIFTYANKMFLFCKEKQEQIRVIDKPHPSHFGLQIASFAKRLMNDEEPEVRGIEGYKDLQIILAAYESYETQKVVQIKPV